MTNRDAKRMLLQKALGLVLLIISAVIIVMGIHGTTPSDSDVTPVFFTIPMGLLLLRTRECVLY